MRGTFCLKISKYKCWMNRHSRDERADKECGIKIWKIILFGAIALGTGFYSLDSQAQEAKDSEYTIIVSDEISDSVEELENAIKNAFGGVKANEINYRSPEAKRIIKKLKVEFIPYVIFEKNISEKEQFLNLLKKRMIVQKQNEYVIPEDMLFPMGGIFLKRKRMPDRVDLFVMSNCPAGNDALRRMIELLEEYEKNIQIEVHYITIFHEFGISSLHGPEEIKEDIHQALVQKKYPEKFWKYQLLYQQKKETGSICEELEIPVQEITGYHNQGVAILEKDFKLCRELGVQSSPTFLWENRVLFNSQHKYQKFIEKKFKNFKKTSIPAEHNYSENITINFFYSPECSGCHWVLDEHIPYLKEKFPGLVTINYFNIADKENFEKMNLLSKKLGAKGGVIPRVIIDDYVLTGKKEIKEKLETLIEENFSVSH